MKDKWSRKVVDGLLSSEKYIGQVLLQKTVVQDGRQVKNIDTNSQFLLENHHPAIISKELFDAVQTEKTKRSNLETTESGPQRKTTKYNSDNVLSGLLICTECGSSYRRIIRSGGGVFWRCANRVEYGKTRCKDSETISDAAIKEFLCRTLDMLDFDEQTVRMKVESILVKCGGNFEITFKQEQNLFMTI